MHLNADKPAAQTVWLFNEDQLNEAVRLYLDHRYEVNVIPGRETTLRIALDAERDAIREFLSSPEAERLTCGTTAGSTAKAQVG